MHTTTNRNMRATFQDLFDFVLKSSVSNIQDDPFMIERAKANVLKVEEFCKEVLEDCKDIERRISTVREKI